MRWWLAAGLLLALLMPISAHPCGTHPIPHDWEEHLASVQPFEETGLLAFSYDVDDDGTVDRVLVYQRDVSGNRTAFPLFYLEGVQADGRAAEVWIDRGGIGTCWDIELYFKREVTYGLGPH